MTAFSRQLLEAAEHAFADETRAKYRTLWEEAASYVSPEDAWFEDPSSSSPDDRRYVFDSTAGVALEIFASFLLDALSSPQVNWLKGEAHKLDGPTPKRSSRPNSVLQWEDEYRDAVLEELNMPGTGFYEAMHTMWLGYGLQGTAALTPNWNSDRARLRFENIALQHIAFDTDASGAPDRVYRTWMPTLRQARQRFPNIDAFLRGKKEDKDTIEMCHAVVPVRETPDPARWRGFAYVGYWIVKDQPEKPLLREGFYTKPYIVSRWYLSPGQRLYGRSPSMTALPDIRVANRIKATMLRAGDKAVDPPMLLPDAMLISPVRMFPSGISYTDGEVDPKFLVPPGGFQVQVQDKVLEESRTNIREAFFMPLFANPDRAVVSATQVLQEEDQRNRHVSPMVVRTFNEAFTPLLDRVTDLLGRRGRLPQSPDPQWGISLKLNSALLASWLAAEALGAVRFLEGMSLAANFDPNVTDAVDYDQLANVLHAGSGAPSSILNSKPAREARRKARADAENQAATVEQGTQQTEAAAKFIGATR